MVFKRRLINVVWRFRVALTRAACPITRRALEHRTVAQFIISVHLSEKYRYVYINNPKTGCTTLKAGLIELELRDTAASLDLSDSRAIYGKQSPLKHRPPIWPSPSLSRRIQQEFTFLSFVRNPYSRLLSCYLDKFAGDAPTAPGILRDLPGHRPPESFATFVHQITEQTDFAMNPHWRPQVGNLLFGTIPYTFIGRFEAYAEDYVRAFATIGVVGDDVPALRHLNKSRKHGVGLGEYYDNELHELVYRRYRADFEAFGYAYDLPD